MRFCCSAPISSLLAACLLLSACTGWDTDHEYAPQHQGGYFLVETPEGMQIERVTPSGADAQWGNALGFVLPTALALGTDSWVPTTADPLWVAWQEGEFLSRFDPSTGALKTAAGFQARIGCLAMGQHRLLAACAGRLVLVNPNSLEHERAIEIDFVPAHCAASTGRFVVVGEGRVAVLNEDAQALEAVWTYDGQAVSLYPDAEQNLRLLVLDSLGNRQRYTWEASTARWLGPIAVSLHSECVSPFKEAYLGTEALGSVETDANRRILSRLRFAAGRPSLPNDSAQWMALDPLLPRLAWQVRDSLFVRNLHNGTVEAAWPTRGPVRQGFLYSAVPH